MNEDSQGKRLNEDPQAILLLAHGTPDRLSEMAPYLQHVTGGRPMPQHVIEELQHRYAEIGLREDPLPEGPPLTRWTLLEGKLLSEALGRKVYVAMRNWHPFIADVVSQMKDDGVTHATVLCLAPQNSRTSTGLYRKALEAAAGDSFTFDFIAGWAEEPLLAQAFAERLQPVLTETRQIESSTELCPAVLFTAHSVPCRTILSSSNEATPPGERPAADAIQNYGGSTTPDPYPVECKQTAQAVAKLAGLNEQDWFFAFQSQGIAGAPWIGPTVEDTLKALSAEGRMTVIVQPIGFLCDHVEILYDIDINFKEFAANLNIRLLRPESLNDSPTLIHALQHVLESTHPASQ